jgi:hypothetical protein
MTRAATRTALRDLEPVLTKLQPLAPPTGGERLLRMPALGVGGY